MALSIGDIIRITLCQKLEDQTVCNVFAYVVDVLVGVVLQDDVQLAFRQVVVPDINVIQSTAIDNERVVTENLTNGIDFTDNLVGGQGLQAQPALSTFEAMSFKYNRQTKITRNGFKRFAGVSAALQTDPNNLDISNTGVTDLAATLGNVLVVPAQAGGGQTATLTPIILGRNPDGTVNLGRFQRVDDVSPVERITSQVTRKIGRGQ